MVRQLRHLIDLARRPQVTVRLVPAGAGAAGTHGVLAAHEMPGSGPLCVEGLLPTYTNGAAAVPVQAQIRWAHSNALPPADTLTVLKRVVARHAREAAR